MVRILVPRFRHGGYKFLPGVLLNAYAHFFTQRDMLIPRLLELRAPVATVQNIVQRRDRFNHQKMTDRRGGRGSDLPLIDKAKLGEKLHRIFAGATGDPLHPFLTRYRLQGHRHQRPQPFILYGGMNGHKANGGFIFRIDIQSADGNQIALFIHHHLMMRHRIPGVAFRSFWLMQRLTQHLPAELVVAL